MTHLRKGEIEDFLTGEAAAGKRAVRHLLAGCSYCQRQVRAFAEAVLGEEPWTAAQPVAEDQYDQVLNRAESAARSLSRRWQKESDKLERAVALLEQAPEGLGDVNFPWRQAQALHGWPLCEALLRKSYEMRFSDPKRMLSLAESAAKVAKNIRPEKYSWPGFLADLRARAFAELGNAFRVNDRHAESDAAFGQAQEFLTEGTGDPLLHARVLDLLASLRRDQRQLEDAIVLLGRVQVFCLEAGDSHLAGRAVIAKGANTYYLGYPREAANIFESGLSLLAPGRDPELEKSTNFNLIAALAECGEFRQASRRLLRSGLREALADEPLNLLKLRWIEGKLHLGFGHSSRAERVLAEVRREFLGRGQVYDAGLVGLELATLWLRQGKAAEVQRLAEETHDVFEELGVQREAARALYFVREACRCQAVTVSMIERVRTFLERLPWQPGLRFEPALFAP